MSSLIEKRFLWEIERWRVHAARGWFAKMQFLPFFFLVKSLWGEIHWTVTRFHCSIQWNIIDDPHDRSGGSWSFNINLANQSNGHKISSITKTWCKHQRHALATYSVMKLRRQKQQKKRCLKCARVLTTSTIDLIDDNIESRRFDYFQSFSTLTQPVFYVWHISDENHKNEMRVTQSTIMRIFCGQIFAFFLFQTNFRWRLDLSRWRFHALSECLSNDRWVDVRLWVAQGLALPSRMASANRLRCSQRPIAGERDEFECDHSFGADNCFKVRCWLGTQHPRAIPLQMYPMHGVQWLQHIKFRSEIAFNLIVALTIRQMWNETETNK